MGTKVAADVHPGGTQDEVHRLQAILDASPDIVVLVDAERRIRWHNAAAVRTLGWSPERVLGADVRDFVVPEDRSALDRAWRTLQQGMPLPGHYEIGLLDADHGANVLEVTMGNLLREPKVEGVVFTCRDRRPEEAARAELTALLGSLQEGLIVVDEEGAIIDASPAALDLFGLRSNDVVTGRLLADVLAGRVLDEHGHEVDLDGHLFRQAFDQDRDLTGVLRGFKHPDGTLRWLSVSVRILRTGGPLRAAVSSIDVTDRHHAEQALRDQVRQDALTGLPNRLELSERLQEVLDARSTGVAVLFLDLDGFKAVNDEHGHHAGDAVLRETARRLRAAVRPGDLVVRYGGDEFVVVCLLCDAPDDALAVCDRVRSAVAEPLAVDGGAVSVRTSVGIAWVDSKRNGIDGSAVLQAADLSLYRVKQSEPGGRDLIVIRF